MFSVAYSRQAGDFLRKADLILRKRLMHKIDQLQEAPFIHDTKALSGFGEGLYRVRVGKYRIVYEVHHHEREIGIVIIEKRSRVY